MASDPIHSRREPRIESYLKRLYGYAYGLTGDSDEAKDLVQECAVKALSAARQPVDETAYRAWLLRIIKNSFIDGLRKRAHESRPLDEEIVYPQGEYFEGDERLIDAMTVRRALTKLPSMHYRIISLIDVAGLSYSKTAEELGIPIGTVMSRISRARKTLIALVGAENVTPMRKKRRVETKT
jgi:RNA polymerase sigma-70 factor (ECF subfamily)